MLKKALAGVLGLAMTLTLAVPAVDVSAGTAYGEGYLEEKFQEEILWAEEEDIFNEDENTGGYFTGEGELSDEELFFSDDAAFSDGNEPFTDTEDTSTEKTLEVTEGEDITEKLNAALLEMKDKATDEKMCKVIIPPGNYTITNTICTYSNIHIYAVGAVIKKVSPGRHVILRLGNTYESAGGYEGYRNIIIEGGTWDANYDSVSDKEEGRGFVDFRIGHATNVVVKDVTFLNNLKSHFLEFGGVKKARVTGCTFRGYWEPYTGGGQECIQIDACRDFIFPDYLPFDGSVCEDILIEGNTFENVFAGVGTHSMMFDRPYKKIVIRGNRFRNIAKRAVWCLNYVDSVVENNVMTNVGTGVYVRSVYSKNTHLPDGDTLTSAGNQYPSNLVISNNEISLNESKMIGTSLWIGYGIDVVGEKVTETSGGQPGGDPDEEPDEEPDETPDEGTDEKPGETPDGGTDEKPGETPDEGTGEKPDETPDESIAGDSDTALDEDMGEEPGVQFLAESAGVPLGRYPIRNVAVKNNKVFGTGHGIRIALAEKCNISNNSVSLKYTEPFDNHGIIVAAGLSASVTGNKVQGAKGRGIYVYKGSAAYNEPSVNPLVSKNTVTACGIDGIALGRSTANAKVESNTVKEVKGNGISVTQGQSVSVSGNKATFCGGNGIFVSSGKKVTVSGNTVSENKVDGIKSEGGHSSFVIKKNKTSKNKGAGMCIGGGKGAVITENEITSNKNNGIAIRDAKDVVITKNTVKGCKGYAVIGTNSSVKTFSGNKLTGNAHTNTIYGNNTSYPYSVKSKKK